MRRLAGLWPDLGLRSRALVALQAAIDSAIVLIYCLLLGVVGTLWLPGPSFTTPGFAPLNRWLGGHEELWLGLGLALAVLPLLALWLDDRPALVLWRLLLAGYTGTMALSFLLGNPHSFGGPTYSAVAAWCFAQAAALAWRMSRAERARGGDAP